MRGAMRMIVGLGGPGGRSRTSPAQYALSQGALLLYDFTEVTVSANATNKGSLGAGFDSVNTAATVGQTGKLGVNHAFSWNGTTTKLTTPNDALFANATKITYAMLINPTNAGEGTTGAFFYYGSNPENRMIFAGSLDVIAARRDAATSYAQTSSSAGFTAGAWAWAFFTYDDTVDRKIHLLKGDATGVAELAGSPDTAASGALINETNSLIIGNDASAALTFNGLIDEFYVFPSVLSTAQMQRLVTLAGF